MTRLDDVRDAAVHGSFCPKMCNYACPVLAATGRETAAPWGLHVTVAALASGERAPDRAAYRSLRGCTGCHACNEACLYDLDVSVEVRAARTEIVATGVLPDAVGAVRTAIEEGASPYGVPPPDLPTDAPSPTEAIVLVGCAETQATLDALASILRACGVSARFRAPDGCCGAVAADLGDAETGASAAESLRELLTAAADDGADRVIATDPHCLGAVRDATDLEVRDTTTELHSLLDEGRLRLSSTPLGPTAYHDPCVLARGEGVVEEPRALLRAAGAEIREPQGHSRRTNCSGAGLGFDLLDVGEAGMVAERRAVQLGVSGRVVTSCRKAARRLAGAGLAVEDLTVVLAAATSGGDG